MTAATVLSAAVFFYATQPVCFTSNLERWWKCKPQRPYETGNGLRVFANDGGTSPVFTLVGPPIGPANTFAEKAGMQVRIPRFACWGAGYGVVCIDRFPLELEYYPLPTR